MFLHAHDEPALHTLVQETVTESCSILIDNREVDGWAIGTLFPDSLQYKYWVSWPPIFKTMMAIQFKSGSHNKSGLNFHTWGNIFPC